MIEDQQIDGELVFYVFGKEAFMRAVDEFVDYDLRRMRPYFSYFFYAIQYISHKKYCAFLIKFDGVLLEKKLVWSE